MRRFPLPWLVKSNNDAFWVEDQDGKQFSFCYFRDDQAGITGKAYLTREEARRLVTKIAGLPGLMGVFEAKGVAEAGVWHEPTGAKETDA